MTSFKFGRKARWSPQRDVRELSAALARAEDERDRLRAGLVKIANHHDTMGGLPNPSVLEARALLLTTPSERKPNT